MLGKSIRLKFTKALKGKFVQHVCCADDFRIMNNRQPWPDLDVP